MDFNVVVKGMSALSPMGNSINEMEETLRREKPVIQRTTAYPHKQVFDRFRAETGNPVIGSFFEREPQTFSEEMKFRFNMMDKGVKDLLDSAGENVKDLEKSDIIVGTSLCGDDALANKALFPNDNQDITSNDVVLVPVNLSYEII